MSTTLYHLAEPDDWATAQENGAYAAPSLAAEGFIHCSTEAQLVATHARHYPGRTDLVLLEIDPDRLGGTDQRWEPSSHGETYPHLYGPVPVTAVRRAEPYEPPGSSESS